MTGLRSEVERFSKYGLVGLINNFVLYLLFVLLVFLGVAPVMTAALCYVLGVLISYASNRRWAFASTDSHAHDLPRFLLAYGVGLVSTMITISLLLVWLPPEVAQIFNIGITALVIYATLRVLRFGAGPGGNAG